MKEREEKIVERVDGNEKSKCEAASELRAELVCALYQQDKINGVLLSSDNTKKHACMSTLCTKHDAY